ncbi:MAG: hypothetical protein COX62_03185 [Deltaproteobacteria bacterium CG_4_10_14_0_2_um_filter_43_8]|nr:MAG: hypothetical protein COV43_01060 [Deltaproteobacteria bacterium CG11_big_fil_rev_8_21_14_0_20_42_23]PJA21117.1 MAG: hypothetical protein COX62_03185 [Deltaproteobacteria bacterium CG_4_10_14_0_2_um_filter_43_8]PJC63559.1 MAG: hypothetical protein CO021_08930 [Deltaproteobacteria bacterium CG_4_9_14_0_2_um_filter_42_21]
MKRIFLFFLLCLFSSCGTLEETSSASLNLQVNKIFSAPHSYGTASHYKLILSADDLEETHFNFTGESETLLLQNVAFGKNRKLFLQAFNKKEQVIYEAVKENINIEAEKRNVIELLLESVPVFTNPSSSRAVYNTHLQFQVFSKPGEEVVIEKIDEDGEQLLLDVSQSSLLLQFSANTGLATFSPELLPAGKYHFQVRNVNNGKKSSLVLTILNGTRTQGAAFITTGFSTKHTQRMGKVTW